MMFFFLVFDDILFFGVFMAYHRLVIGLLRKDLISVKDTEIIDVFERVGKNLYKILVIIPEHLRYREKNSKKVYHLGIYLFFNESLNVS